MEELKITEKLELEISKERGKVSSDKMDISFGEIINLYKNEELIIQPEYQRLYRWTAQQKTALIESLLLGIPIPAIFVAEDENGIWELVDGLQRVATFISFFGELKTDIELRDNQTETGGFEDEEKIDIGNKWKLEAGSILKSLKGYDIDTLPTKFKINLKRAACRVEILRGESNTTIKYELFKRLNSGGSKLTPQEIRNAVYRGINPKLNELIIELSQHEVFQELTSLTKTKKQELYDQELILRFIAFLDSADKVNDNTEKYLNYFMEKSVNNKEFPISDYRDRFVEVISLLGQLSNEKVFKSTNKRNLFVPAVFEGITIAVAQNIELYRNDLPFLEEKVEELKSDADFKKFSGQFSNSKNRIKNRLTRANEIFSAKKD
jgi:hypothetical protein